MKRMWVSGLCAALLIAAGPLFAAPGIEAVNHDDYRPGLAAHYYGDPDQWDGLWPNGLPCPSVSAADWTFTSYKYTREEPLVNHQFIHRGWFSVRWQGYLDTVPAGARGEEAAYTFSIWADDGCRLFLDDQKLIDDWRPCAQDDPSAVRTATVTLTPGKHKIVVEYFQGQSLQHDDRDPMKLYWECEGRHIPCQIVPASHFSHKAADLQPTPGRLDR